MLIFQSTPAKQISSPSMLHFPTLKHLGNLSLHHLSNSKKHQTQLQSQTFTTVMQYSQCLNFFLNFRKEKPEAMQDQKVKYNWNPMIRYRVDKTIRQPHKITT